MTPAMSATPTRAVMMAAFAAIYVVWGSTYLAIQVGIESMPPFLMAGGRFLAAGLVLFGWMRLRGAAMPTARQWRSAAILGTLLMCGGNGLVTWAEQYVPSSIAALMIATVPLWMVLLDGFVFGGSRPTASIWIGLLMGFSGVALLMSPGRDAVGDVHPWGALGLVTAAASWAVGSLKSRGADLPRSPALAASLQMIGGGVALLLVGMLRGEWRGFDVASVSTPSWIAFAYLVVFGSIVALSAYVWLLRVTTPARVGTYAFVNPVVAVVLGWLFAGEALGAKALVAAALILGGVVFIQWARVRMPRVGRRSCAGTLMEAAAEEA